MSLKDLNRSLLTSYSLQAQHNAFAIEQAEREIRLRANLDKLEALKAAREGKTDAN